MKPKNILSYTPFYMGAGHNGGAETTLHDVMRLLRAEKHNTTALVSKPAPDGQGSYVLDGVKVQDFASKRDPEFYIPAADIILTHLGDAARAGILARRAKKPVVHLIHNDQPYCVGYAEKYADALVFNTAWVAEAYRGCAVPTTVLHPIVDPKRYEIESNRRYITLVNLCMPEDRLSYDKGALTFYELARRFPNEEFLAVKGGYGQQYVPDDLPDNVRIVAHTNNILDVYRRTKVILTPSKYESFGRVPLEAAASSIPSVITETAGTREAMGYSARFCQYGNYDEWEAGLNEVLEDYNHYSYYAKRQAWIAFDRTLREWELFIKLLEDLEG